MTLCGMNVKAYIAGSSGVPIALRPDLPTAHSLLGRALMGVGRRDEAVAAFRKELEKDPNDFDSNLYLGVTLKEEQKYDEALGFLQHALEVRPGDLGVLFQIASLHLAERNLERRERAGQTTRSTPAFTGSDPLD